MKLSGRLQRISEFVTKGNILADIGTDHGYIPIYLVENNVVPYAYACDVKEGPLERAREHIAEHKLEDKIRLRLSNGLEKLEKSEADTILIAGMGGELIIDILKSGKEVLDTAKELIVSPHSEINLVRKYLNSEKYILVEEDMIKDAGKYYVIMKWVKGEGDSFTEDFSECELLYGKILLRKKNPVLSEYLNNEKNNYYKILSLLDREGKSDVILKKDSIKKRLLTIEEALCFYN